MTGRDTRPGKFVEQRAEFWFTAVNDIPVQSVRIAGQVTGWIRADDVTADSGGVVGGHMKSTGRMHIERAGMGTVAGAVAEAGTITEGVPDRVCSPTGTL